MTKQRILIVDDEAELVKAIQIRLEQAGYEVIVAYDGQEALEKARKDKPDLIILDIVMPGMDGYQISEQLRQGEITRNIPIILLTGKELEPRGIEERCLQLGVEGWLLKPVDTKGLLTKIEEVLKER